MTGRGSEILNRSFTWLIAAWVVPGVLWVIAITVAVFSDSYSTGVTATWILGFLAGQASIGFHMIADGLKELEEKRASDD